jgi:hypothetical protein
MLCYRQYGQIIIKGDIHIMANYSIKDLCPIAEYNLFFYREELERLTELKNTIQQRIKNLAYNLAVGNDIRDKDCVRMADTLSEYQEVIEEIADLEEKIRMAKADLENLQEELAEEE